MEEVCAALRDAKYGLTEDGVGAVVAIRRYRAILSTVEDLVLRGELNAERRPGVTEDMRLTIHDYIFSALSDGERRKPTNTEESGDNEGESIWALTEKGKRFLDSRQSESIRPVSLFEHLACVPQAPGVTFNGDSN